MKEHQQVRQTVALRWPSGQLGYWRLSCSCCCWSCPAELCWTYACCQVPVQMAAKGEMWGMEARISSSASQWHGQTSDTQQMFCAGRKHQIRIHCADALGLPVLGDSKYGRQCELTANLLALPNHAPCSAGLRCRRKYTPSLWHELLVGHSALLMEMIAVSNACRDNHRSATWPSVQQDIRQTAAQYPCCRALLRERHLFLHSSRVCIVAGQSRPVVDIEAPLPAHMLKLGKLVRWDA